MDYKFNIIVHIINMYNLGLTVNYMGKGRSKWEFHGHLARFPLHLWHIWHQWWRFYDNYDTSQIWRLTYDISDMSDLNRSSYMEFMGVGEGQEAPTWIWEKREGEERGHMA